MVKPRDRRDRIIVTEKLDGSCVAVARIGREIVPLIRAGFRADSAPREQHRMFHRWVMSQCDRFMAALEDGERLVGEWLALAHGTRYALPHEPFVAFDLLVENRRYPHDELHKRCERGNITTAAVLSDGPPAHVDEILPLIAESRHGAIDPVEGAVWRVERNGVFDFIAKWVRPDKQDGKYFAEVTCGPDVWNWREDA